MTRSKEVQGDESATYYLEWPSIWTAFYKLKPRATPFSYRNDFFSRILLKLKQRAYIGHDGRNLQHGCTPSKHLRRSPQPPRQIDVTTGSIPRMHFAGLCIQHLPVGVRDAGYTSRRLRKALVPAMLCQGRTECPTSSMRVKSSVSLRPHCDVMQTSDLCSCWQLTTALSPTHATANTSVLEAAHSTFTPWRVHIRSDALLSEDNYVLTRVTDYFLQLFRHIFGLLLTPSSSPPAPALVT
ncbi:hypothetical protein FIBSPDRAFT_889229 [Athelia psychrophila]|uniref:Uncharacterized protein n=1 Tax=Athelia psychrophila TaxID=1759441 RepID=A0A166MHE3_9AGAM|nr:hypothetical protein FIBSPDRAFT_889229 [Fibularhizoctonia sp. CBS 109695]